jgi:hypothetical protein
MNSAYHFAHEFQDQLHFVSARLAARSLAASSIGLLAALTVINPNSVSAQPSTNDPATNDPARACVNAAIFKLDGIPRQDLTTSTSGAEADGTRYVDWQARDGRAGYCRLDASGQVTQFSIEVNEITRPTETQDWVTAGTTVWVWTDGGALNLRSAPGGEIIGDIPNGSPVVATGQTSGEWVELEGGKWASRFLLTQSEAESSSVRNPDAANSTTSADSGSSPDSGQARPGQGSSRQYRIATSDGSGVNIRNQPNGDIIASLPDGAAVELTGQSSEGWVELQGGGWVSQAFVRR